MEISQYKKKCKWCGEIKNIYQFYQQEKTYSNGEPYIYVHPECKECTMKNSTKWRKENPEQYKVFYTNRNQKPYFKKKMRVAANKQREEGKQDTWRKNNPDKVKMYNKNHRNHDITDQEWFDCLDYFNNNCAYCGLPEEIQYKLYNEQFHKEHVIHDGTNYIDNCIPSCTRCNTSKHDSEFNDWYNEENDIFSKRRLNKIIKWMTKDCFKVLNLQ